MPLILQDNSLLYNDELMANTESLSRKKDSDVGIKAESSPYNSRKIYGMNRQIKENTKVGTSLID